MNHDTFDAGMLHRWNGRDTSRNHQSAAINRRFPIKHPVTGRVSMLLGMLLCGLVSQPAFAQSIIWQAATGALVVEDTETGNVLLVEADGQFVEGYFVYDPLPTDWAVGSPLIQTGDLFHQQSNALMADMSADVIPDPETGGMTLELSWPGSGVLDTYWLIDSDIHPLVSLYLSLLMEGDDSSPSGNESGPSANKPLTYHHKRLDMTIKFPNGKPKQAGEIDVHITGPAPPGKPKRVWKTKGHAWYDFIEQEWRVRIVEFFRDEHLRTELYGIGNSRMRVVVHSTRMGPPVQSSFKRK